MTEALDLLAGLRLESGQRWGEVATEWQQGDARAVLEPAEGEPRLHWLSRPKGASKSTDVAGMAVCWLVAQADELAEGYIFSADLDQSNRLLTRARGLVARTSGLGEVLSVESRRIVHRSSGASVVASAADAAGSEGILTPLIVLEELPNWPRTQAAKGVLVAAISSVPKMVGCRLVVIGHAGDPSHYSRKLLDQAETSVMWRVSEIPGPTPWISSDQLEEQRALLLPSEYARRWLNQWTAAEDRLATSDDVHACLRHSGPLSPEPGVSDYIATLDVGLTNDRTVASVGHAVQVDGARRVVLDRQVAWQGSKAQPVDLGQVEGWLAEAHREYRLRKVIVDPYQAVHLVQRLRARGVPVDTFTFTATSVGKLAVTLFRALRDHLLDLPDDDDELVHELVNVRLRETQPGIFRIDHDSSQHDDRVIGLALLAQELLGDAAGPVRAHAPLPTAENPFRGRKTMSGAPGVAGMSGRSGQPGRVEAWRPGGRPGWGAGRRVSTRRSER